MDTSIFKNLEELIRKTTEANKVFMSEGTRFYKNFDYGTLKEGKILDSQMNLLTDAFNTFMKLNIQYASNLIDLGLAVSNRMGPQEQESPEFDQSVDPPVSAPAFVLDVSSQPGQKAETEFQLNSQKKETIKCYLEQSPFIDQKDPSVTRKFKTTFSPQSFNLDADTPQLVQVTINIPLNARQGDYYSNVKVLGYEETFFSISLKIMPKQKNPKK